jgi:hypothetical protein
VESVGSLAFIGITRVFVIYSLEQLKVHNFFPPPHSCAANGKFQSVPFVVMDEATLACHSHHPRSSLT